MAALEMDVSGAGWFFTDRRFSKVDRLQALSLCITDILQGTCVSLSGRGELDADRGRIERLWTPFAPDDPEPTNLVLLKCVPDAADDWNASNSQTVRASGVLASMVAGKPIALGVHGSHKGLWSAAGIAP